jgi:hypothetical protein
MLFAGNKYLLLKGITVCVRGDNYVDTNLTEQGHHAVKLYSVVLPGLDGCSVSGQATMLTPIIQSKSTMPSNFTLLYCLAWVAALCPWRQLCWLQSYRARAPRRQTLLCCLAWLGWLLYVTEDNYIDSNLTEQGHHAVKLYTIVLLGLGGCSVSWKTTMLTPVLQSKGTMPFNFSLLSYLAWMAALCHGPWKTTMLTPLLQSKGTTPSNFTLLSCLAWVAALCQGRQLCWLQSYRARAPRCQTLLCCLAWLGWLLCVRGDNFVDSSLT